ncbi:glycosyltransferase family 4 protein [Alteribacter natronophilus]|uniref:glycosyltransferase family 4 protein n=1 Tax=Alteribacter natronophilus TaxID=2583810 RepID=UPI00110F071E|nr:glycosyltransferase family 1 protein [Alteribacter natronophilus]TMW71803.1 glycosyltransferase family 1 protein [Alteribacter natronophilus]
MRIALFTDTFTPQVNGVAKTLQRLVTYMENQSIEHEVFVPDTVHEEPLFKTNVHRFASLPFFLYPECRLAFPNLLTVRQQLHKFRPTLLHVATPFNMGLCGLRYARKYNVPFVASYHTHFDSYLKYYNLGFAMPWIWKYQRWFHEGAEKIFVPSLETRKHLLHRGFKHLELWPRGVDCDHFSPARNDGTFRQKYAIGKKHILLYAGRVAPEKDISVLSKVIETMNPFLKQNTQWVITGDGPVLQDMKDRHGDSVLFTGYLDGTDLAQAYAAADLFVFPSSTETFGNVVLEALASGTPAVVARSGGVQEIVTDGVTGKMCEPASAESFGTAVETLLSSAPTRRLMGARARSYARTQSWSKIFSDLIAGYEEAHRSRQHEQSPA